MDEQPEITELQMQRFGISRHQKVQFTYRGYVYDRLTDAFEYAKIDSARQDDERRSTHLEAVDPRLR